MVEIVLWTFYRFIWENLIDMWIRLENIMCSIVLCREIAVKTFTVGAHRMSQVFVVCQLIVWIIVCEYDELISFPTSDSFKSISFISISFAIFRPLFYLQLILSTTEYYFAVKGSEGRVFVFNSRTRTWKRRKLSAFCHTKCMYPRKEEDETDFRHAFDR